MKNKIILLFLICIIILWANPTKSMGTTWNIDHFSDGPLPENALINRGSFAFGQNDVLNFTNALPISATSNIDTNMPSTTLTLNGNNNTLADSSYEGIYLTNGSNYTIEDLKVSGFSGISHTDASNYKSTGGGFIYQNAFSSGASAILTSLCIKNSTFSGNYASTTLTTSEASGGVFYYAMYKNTVPSVTNTLNINNSNFSNNYVSTTTLYANGGVLYYRPIAAGGYNMSGSTVNITDSNFKDNYAKSSGSSTTVSGANGGVIYYQPYGVTGSSVPNHNSFTISGSTPGLSSLSIFEGNYASSSSNAYGGVAYVQNSHASDNIFEMVNSIFNNNYTSATIAAKGGVLYYRNYYTVSNNNSLEVNNCIFNGNKANGGSTFSSLSEGGAIYYDNYQGSSNQYVVAGESFIVNGSEFTNNESNSNTQAQGGAISILYDKIPTIANNTTTISNSIFDRNKATSSMTSGTSHGGAICNSAVYNTSGTYNNYLTIANCEFNNNSATGRTAQGGAIYNTGIATITNGNTFTSNNAANGGAIYNTGLLTLTNANSFTGNYTTNGNGGAIYNFGSSADSLTEATFNYNYTNTTGNGGAIYNSGSNLSLSSANFNNNGKKDIGGGTSTTYTQSGGAIYNSGTIKIAGNSFTGNAVTTSGGAIYNSGTANITNTDFTNNSAKTNGGAIYNSGTLHIQTDGGTSTFSGNNVSGKSNAIYNAGTIYLDTGSGSSITFNDAITSSIKTRATNINSGSSLNSGTVNFNNDISTSTLNIANGTTNVGKNSISNTNVDNIAVNITGGTQNFTNTTFKNNSRICVNDITPTAAESTNFINSTFNGYSYTGSGAAIYNASGKVNISPTNFSGFTSSGNGGAIYNAGTTVFSGGTYDNNTATNGGAVYNEGIATFTNTSFTGNHATANGGAIYNLGTLYLKADGGQIVLSGNTAGSISNGLYNHGTVYLNAGNGGTIVFNDTVDSSDITTSTININSPLGSSTLNTGTVYFNNNITNSTINLYNGAIVIGNESYISSNNLGIYDGIIDTQNNHIGTMGLNNATFVGISNWLMDVDLANKIGDTITTTGTTSGILDISSIKLLSDATALKTTVPVADTHTKNHLSTSVTSVNGALFKYGVSYDSSSGVLNFIRTGVSPYAVSSGVSQTSTFLLQTAIDRQFFGNVDSFMSFPLAQRESTICCSIADGQTTGAACPISGNGTFSPIYSCDLNRGIWMKDFVSFESIPLHNGPDVSTIEYGTLIGGDTPLKYLKHGIVGNTSAYVDYLGSNQNYDRVGISQNGVLVGLAENMVRGNNFLTIMSSVGDSLANATTPYGQENFSAFFAGAGAKGGHNFEFKDGEYIFQPNLMLAYTFTNTFNYKAASGINMTSKPLNAIQIAPGLKFIKNMKNEKGQVYLVTNMVFNEMDKTNFSANNLQLPQLSINPYVEYGFGYQRVWKERFNGFFQTLFRGGGRNGVAFQFGLRWAI